MNHHGAAAVEVFHSYLLSAAEEMRRTLIRTAFNPVVYEVLDFGISIYNEDLDLIAEAPGLTFFLGANDYAIRKGVEHAGAEHMEPGDIFLLNYPYWSSAHVNDVTLFAPIFAPQGERPFAYTCIRAHWMDLGAKDAGYVLDSTDMHQEGLIFPAVKILRRGVMNEDLVEMIRFNSRMPELVLGDLNAQIAATRTGERRLVQLVERFGRNAFRAFCSRIQDHEERMVRGALKDLPHGCWRAEDFLDDDGISDDPIRMVATVSIDDERFSVDFGESQQAVRGPVNIPYGLTQTMCKVVLKSLTTPHTPSNGGLARLLRVIAPPGNLFHAVYPAPTFTLWSAIAGFELIYKALAQGMPERLTASSGGDVPGFMAIGIHKETGKLYAVSNNDPVGWGAMRDHDGCNATNHLPEALVRNTPVEVLEMKTSMQVESVELRTDSGGAGKHRGGLGQRRDLRFTGDAELISVMKKSKTRPWALAGGSEPEPNAMVLFPDTSAERRVGTARTSVGLDDRASNRTAGGGGYGDPMMRDPQDVLEDVLDGYVSAKAARDVYGVVISDENIDWEQTEALRSAS